MNSARGQDSSVGGGAGNICLGVVQIEEEVQEREQVEVGREEQGVGETHGKEQGEEQRENRRPIIRSSWMTMDMGDAHKHILEPMWCNTSSSVGTVQEKNDV